MLCVVSGEGIGKSIGTEPARFLENQPADRAGRCKSLLLEKGQLVLFFHIPFCLIQNTNRAEAFFSQRGKDGQIIIFVRVNPLCDGLPAEALREQSFEKAARSRGIKRR